MSVSLNNFVTISITKHQQSTVSSMRDTAVLICSTAKTASAVYSSYDALAAAETDAALLKYAKIFFDNGGLKLHVIQSATGISRNEILVASTDPAFDAATVITAVDVPEQKIFVGETTTSAAIAGKPDGTVMKFVTTAGSGSGIEMATLAYYTKIRIYNSNAAKDYDFTAESFDDTAVSSFAVTSQDDSETCITNNLNFITYLAGAYRNIGGNDCNGNNITNLFMRIVLQQTLQDRLINLLTSKIKYDSRGMVAVSSAICTELNRYVSNGYIATNRAWTDDDLYIDDNLVIAANNPLTAGYVVYIAPFSTLTAADLAAHKFPKITIIYADQYSIRVINIVGEVF
jgi:hypothetical protein